MMCLEWVLLIMDVWCYTIRNFYVYIFQFRVLEFCKRDVARKHMEKICLSKFKVFGSAQSEYFDI
jgi:hypothetical protein